MTHQGAHMVKTQHDEESIFTEARKIESPAERAAYIQEASKNDAALIDRVEALLDVHDQDSKFLNDPPIAPNINMPPGTETVGSLIGPYKLMEQIGEGGMGVVYVAKQTEPVKRKVALKIIKPGMDTKQVITRFEAERQALALMDHPNIAKVLDAGTTKSGHPYFVMELIRGISITKYCDKKNLTTRQRLDLFIKVCRAIHHAHQTGISSGVPSAHNGHSTDLSS